LHISTPQNKKKEQATFFPDIFAQYNTKETSISNNKATFSRYWRITTQKKQQ
jgi:hypothetical protein